MPFNLCILITVITFSLFLIYPMFISFSKIIDNINKDLKEKYKLKKQPFFMICKIDKFIENIDNATEFIFEEVEYEIHNKKLILKKYFLVDDLMKFIDKKTDSYSKSTNIITSFSIIFLIFIEIINWQGEYELDNLFYFISLIFVIVVIIFIFLYILNLFCFYKREAIKQAIKISIYELQEEILILEEFIKIENLVKKIKDVESKKHIEKYLKRQQESVKEELVRINVDKLQEEIAILEKFVYIENILKEVIDKLNEIKDDETKNYLKKSLEIQQCKIEIQQRLAKGELEETSLMKV